MLKNKKLYKGRYFLNTINTADLFFFIQLNNFSTDDCCSFKNQLLPYKARLEKLSQQLVKSCLKDSNLGSLNTLITGPVTLLKIERESDGNVCLKNALKICSSFNNKKFKILGVCLNNTLMSYTLFESILKDKSLLNGTKLTSFALLLKFIQQLNSNFLKIPKLLVLKV